MGIDTKIEWCHHTANTWWGCTKVSDGCKNCYAETFAKRTGYDVWGPRGSRRMMKGVWNEVRKWAVAAASAGERRRVFWGSMMDVCEDRPELVEPRKRFCGIVEELEDLDFLLLTKRPENYVTLMPWGKEKWPRNVWAGTSAENQAAFDSRVSSLFTVNASIRWLSEEPLLGPLDQHNGFYCPRLSVNDPYKKLMRGRIDWVVVGGESGGKARACNIDWIRSIVKQCKEAGVPVFVKQMGSDAYYDPPIMGVEQAGMGMRNQKDPKGGDMTEWPEDLRIREMPKAVPS